MAKAWRYRLFRYGKMPAQLRAASRDVGALYSTEGVSVKIHGRSVALPGVRAHRSVQLAVGSFVLSPGRVMAAIGPWVILDTDLTADPASPHTLAFDPEGIQLHVSVPEIYPGGRGTFELEFREPLGGAVLGQLPAQQCAVSLPEGIAAFARRWV